jgi:hypothetical protein
LVQLESLLTSVNGFFFVEDRTNIYKLILLFNGNIVLNHRFIQFAYFVNAFNQRLFKNKSFPLKVKLLENLNNPTLNDGWFSGFVDAEGCFNCPVELTRKHISHYISICFEVGQNGEIWLFPYLKALLGDGCILFPSVLAEDKHNRIIYKGLKRITESNITNYLYNYPLQTEHKSKSYLLWLEMLNHIKMKNHLNRELLPKLVIIAYDLNKIK